ncbi:MAG: fructuronate reductase [Clostridiales bacterium]|jgi:fructuronate reductase|nr:fructuronate reductase [Clostridiales bacterium]MDK2933553.1 fructuronate reductase [Clostridiales bacterium]
MKLSIQSLKNEKVAWELANVKLPTFNIEALNSATRDNPTWVHFGAGNIFRGFIAKLQHNLLASGKADTGIIAVDTFDYDIIDKIYTAYDNLTILVLMKPNGVFEKSIVASVTEAIKANSSDNISMNRLKEIFTNPKLQMASFTITEKGYALANIDGDFFPVVHEDIINGPKHAKHTMSIVASLVYERYLSTKAPIALVSMDNCSHNGDKLRASILTISKEWEKRGFVDKDFISYLENESMVSFPWSMIDKITPRPSELVQKHLEEQGIENMAPIITSKNTFIAPFVNAEETEYLVIEDKFPNGRPPLELAGVYFTDRETVNNTERMKVTTCLNPLHTALAVYGCLLGYTSIASEMKDTQLKKLVEKIGYEEGMPVVVNPKILDPLNFIKDVINNRLPNPFIPDSPQRIATDTSQKIAIRFGETIKSYMEREDLNPADLIYIPLVLAGWCRYLLGIDDKGNPMELSSDPMLPQLTSALKDVKFGDPSSYQGQLKPILSNPLLFGVDLYEVGLGEKVENLFLELISGEGAVRKTLIKYVG